jgi:hypothetical protein
MSSGVATIPAPDAAQISSQNCYYCFEMEVNVDSSATSLSGLPGWAWISGGELPATGYAGHTLYI